MKSLDFQDLREEIVSTVSVPDLDDIYRRGRRRELATHPSWVIGAAVIVVVAALVGGNLLGSRLSQPAVNGRPPLGVAVHFPLKGSEIPVDGPFTVLTSVTSDQWTTYTIVKTTNGTLAVARTFDSGAHWFAWTLPAEITKARVVNFDSAGPGQFVSVIVNKSGKDVLFISMDGGESWVSQPALGSAVDAFPAGWALDVQYRQVVAVDPANGVPHPLKNKWASEYPYLGEARIVPAKDGSLWRTTYRPDTWDQPVKFEVSRDRGRTWLSKRPPLPPGKQQMVADIDSLDGRTGYATVSYTDHTPSSGNRPPNSYSILFVTHDGGKTWTRVGPDLSYSSALTVMPDGRLFALRRAAGSSSIFDSSEVQVSSDGGKSFHQLPGAQPFVRQASFRGVMRTPTGGYVILASQRIDAEPGNAQSYQWYMTTDGDIWTQTPTPPSSTATPWDVGPSPFR
jgi:photosystem II stability/assembly factor-like uncharacterized protein